MAATRLQNTLNPSNVSGIDLDRSDTTASALTSSPAVANGVVYVDSFDDSIDGLKGA